ncbi:hypothetical protein, partial [Myxosarcina sp. GI1]|uniref:hypothetical protein n=1 Tax=Myxosarcina sp. GI1 TaxID=1541065 RepID=UPI00055E0D65
IANNTQKFLDTFFTFFLLYSEKYLTQKIRLYSLSQKLTMIAVIAIATPLQATLFTFFGRRTVRKDFAIT